MSEPELHLERMTWPEVADALARGWTTAVVAVGATEQHGPHLPLLVDAERGTRLAEEVARRLGKALVAPTIRVGCSDHHLSFPGTLSIRRETLRHLCRDYCVSLARHGFGRICFVPSHGGNFVPLRQMLPELRRTAGEDCRVDAYTDLDGFLEEWRAAVEETVGLGGRVGGHADIAESSEMLVIRPELVHEERAEPGYVGEVTPELLERVFREGFRSVTDNGILGDARGMSEEIGRRCLERTADAVVGAMEEGEA